MTAFAGYHAIDADLHAALFAGRSISDKRLEALIDDVDEDILITALEHTTLDPEELEEGLTALALVKRFIACRQGRSSPSTLETGVLITQVVATMLEETAELVGEVPACPGYWSRVESVAAPRSRLIESLNPWRDAIGWNPATPLKAVDPAAADRVAQDLDDGAMEGELPEDFSARIRGLAESAREAGRPIVAVA